ncbi:hypothetical protein V495_03871, partial [Pseudogymnoascus sp. VKM F-4514 (FW-929)]
MYACAVRPNCTIPGSGIVEFNGDPDIDGIGFIAAFFATSFLTIIVLAATYITSDPRRFADNGFSKLDELVVDHLQTLGTKIAIRTSINVRTQTKENFDESLRKATLVLSDQQLLTGTAMAIAGLIRHCDITQYHFDTVLSLVLAAAVAHIMTFSLIKDYISQNSFFRIWRAVAMALFGALCFGIFIVAGNNNWVKVYGLPAQCGYDNLGEGFGPPASASLGLLYWFFIQGYSYSLTVLVPTSTKLRTFNHILNATAYFAQICKYLAVASKYADFRQEKCQKSIPVEPGLVVINLRLSYFKTKMHRLSYRAWSFASKFTKLSHAAVYGACQVFSSYLFNISWAFCNIIGSAKNTISQRKTAAENGMRGSENQWGYGQLLSVLLLVPLVSTVINPFFDNPVLADSENASVVSSEGVEEQTSTPLHEVGDTATECYDPPEQ